MRNILKYPFSFCFFIILWEILSTSKLLNPILFSKPSEIFLNIYELILGTNRFLGHSLLFDIYASLYRTIIALICALCLGLFLGMLIGLKSEIYSFFNPLITFILPIPGIAWAPIFMIWLGLGNSTIITVGFLASFLPILYNVYSGIRSTKKEMIWLSKTMGLSNLEIYTKIMLPSSLPFILTGLKLGFARGWRTIIAVEMIAGTMIGLGYVIFDAKEFLLPSIIYGGIIILAVIYLIIEQIINKVEERTIKRWGMVK